MFSILLKMNVLIVILHTCTFKRLSLQKKNHKHFDTKLTLVAPEMIQQEASLPLENSILMWMGWKRCERRVG